MFAWLMVGCGATTSGATAGSERTEAPAERVASESSPRTHPMTFGGPSMEPLLADGEEFTVVEASSFERGDVVVLIDAEGNPVAKRIVALAGETVSFAEDVLQLNGEPVPTTELGPAQNTDRELVCYEERMPGAPAHVILQSSVVPPEDMDLVTVPPQHVFVLGDNRDQSNDSRYMLGLVPLERIAGRVVVDATRQRASRVTCPAP